MKPPVALSAKDVKAELVVVLRLLVGDGCCFGVIFSTVLDSLVFSNSDRKVMPASRSSDCILYEIALSHLISSQW